jgi:MFS family permease
MAPSSLNGAVEALGRSLLADAAADEPAVAAGAATAPAPLGAVLQRLYVVAVFSTYAFMQGLCWAIPGPLSSAYLTLYGADAAFVQLLVNIGPIIYVLVSLPLALWMDRPGGMRPSVLLGISLVTVGQVLRTLAFDGGALSTALLVLSYVLNAASGPVAMGAVGRISETFFPVEQRATSTAVMAEANLLGVAGAMLFGPLIVQSAVLSEMATYNYAILGVLVPTQIAAMAYFPSAPLVAPSASAAQLKEHERSAGAAGLSLSAQWATVKTLLTNPSFVVLVSAYGFATGMFGSWATVLSINLSACSSLWVGWLSFSMTVAGGVGGIVTGRFVDRFRNLKAVLVTLLALSAACFLSFGALCSGVVPSLEVCDERGEPGPGMSILFILGTLGGLFLNSTIPIFYELTLEVTYPEPEATVLILLTNMNNLACIVFLSIPNNWLGINFLFAGTVAALAAATQIVFVEQQLRLNVDLGRGQDKAPSAAIADAYDAAESDEAGRRGTI